MPDKVAKPNYGNFNLQSVNGILVVSDLRIPNLSLKDNGSYGWGCDKGFATSRVTVKNPIGENKAGRIYFRMSLIDPKNAIDKGLLDLQAQRDRTLAMARSTPSLADAAGLIVRELDAQIAAAQGVNDDLPSHPIVAELAAIHTANAEVGADVEKQILALLADAKGLLDTPTAAE